MSDAVTGPLTERLDADLRRQIRARRDGMVRELRFLSDKRDPMLTRVRQHGWSNERLSILCGLNSFYLFVMGPLASSASDRSSVIGRDMVIQYGESLRFDAHRGARIRSAHASFMQSLEDVPDAHGVLTAARFGDLLFRLHRALERDRER